MYFCFGQLMHFCSGVDNINGEVMQKRVPDDGFSYAGLRL